jgi:hypothetical protein
MNDSKIAAKLRAQLKRFLGELLPHFSKPKTAFLGDMFYGLMAGGDVKLSKICRAYRPTITMKKAGDRLCMHLDDERIEKTLHSFIARKVARRVKPDTLIIVDPSDIQKPYATQMDFLSKVWDGSKGAVGDNLGYYGCMAVACENGGRRPMPMHLRFWSPDAPGFTSENDELESVFDVIIGATGGRGIFIYDRGGDNIEFYRYFLRKNVDFIVRLKSRSVISWKRRLMCDDLAAQCTLRYADTITFDSHGKTFRVVLNYGVVPVRLPEISGRLLHMVVVKGFGQKPMMLLTTLAKTTARKDLWQVVTAYITRWRVEETIRYIKQAYNLEDIRLLRYRHLKNMAAIVLATAYFCMTWIGNSDKRTLIAKAITDASLRIHELPEFHFYAIAEGIRMLLSRCGRWLGFGKDDIDDKPDLFTFFACDE